MFEDLKGKIFAVYKPKGITSAAVVEIIKRKTKEKVGHAGTLDPLAKGVLVVGVGRSATKNLNEELKKEKEYVALIKLGEFSSTDDEEGEKNKVEIKKKPSKKEILSVLKKFTGKFWQKPPLFSAIKIKGKEAYKYARAGKKISLLERLVEAKEIDLIYYRWPYLKIKIVCGPGFYIRSLARDIGETLETGAYLKDLERIRVGDFKKENCLTLGFFFQK